MTVNDTSTNPAENDSGRLQRRRCRDGLQLVVVVNRRAVVLFVANLQAQKNRARRNGAESALSKAL